MLVMRDVADYEITITQHSSDNSPEHPRVVQYNHHSKLCRYLHEEHVLPSLEASEELLRF